MSKHRVLGMKRYKGTPEAGGPSYDQTKLRVEMKVSSRRLDTEVGMAEQEFIIGTSDEFDKLKHLPFPLDFELEFEQTNRGSEVVSYRPLTPQKAAA
jgi:hypothetical protein